MEQFQFKIMQAAIAIPAILVAFVVHEIAHAYVAFLFGDPTAKYEGRFSPDPRKHLDPMGALVLLGTLLFTNMAFGWAKPVNVNPNNFRNPRQDMAWVAFAGPLSNFTMAAIVGLLLRFGIIEPNNLVGFLVRIFVSINIGLGLFNLIPFPPLDGSKILYGILPADMAYNMIRMEARYRNIIPIILIILIVSPIPIIDMLVGPPYTILFKAFTGLSY